MFYAVATRPARSFQGSCAPAQSLSRGNGELDRFINQTLSSLSSSSAAKSATVEDLEKSYTLQLDVPGVAKEHLDISVEADVVRVTSKAAAPRQVKAAWRFPLEIDSAGSSAKLENGVLSLTLGKKITVSNVSQLAIQ